LEELILEVHLAVHHINIGLLFSFGLQMKEYRVIEELADWLVIVLEIKEGVNESQTEHLGAEKLFDLASALAWHFAVRGVAFQ
jgi:hypothetical protein